MEAIKKNLKQDGSKRGEMMRCRKCGGEYSADRGDYFWAPEDHKFKCCGRVMELVTKREVYQPVVSRERPGRRAHQGKQPRLTR